MNTQRSKPGGQGVAKKHSNNRSLFTVPACANNASAGKHNSPFTIAKRSNVMNATQFISRAIVALVAVLLIAGVALGQGNLVLNGAATLGGTWRVNGNINNSGSTGNNTFSGTVELKGTGAQNIGGHASNVVDFATITTTGISTKTFTTSSTVATSINTGTGGATQWVVAADKKLTLQGTILNGGGASTPYVFSNSGAEVDYAGGTQNIYSDVTYDKLTVSTSGTKSLQNAVTVASALSVSAGDLSIGANTLTINGTYSVAGTVTGGGSSNMVLGGTGDVASFAVTNGLNNFTLNRDTYSVTLGAGLTVADALALNNGTLAVSTQTLTLAGSVSAAGSGALTSASNGTVDYSTGAQDVLAANYGNLSFTAGDKTLPTSGTVGIAGTFAPGAGTHTSTSSTVEFNGGTQNIPIFNYNNLYTSGGGSAKTATGNLTVGGTFDNGGPSNDAVTLNMGTYTLGVTGDNTASTIQFGGGDNGKLFTTGTVEYNGNVQQTIEGHASNSYATLVFSGSGSKLITSAAGKVRTASSLNASTDLQVGANSGDTTAELQVDGNFTIGAISVTNYGIITVGN